MPSFERPAVIKPIARDPIYRPRSFDPEITRGSDGTGIRLQPYFRFTSSTLPAVGAMLTVGAWIRAFKRVEPP